MKFLHVLGEIFSPHAILENPCQPRPGVPEWFKRPKKPRKITELLRL
jgi:hypothetical protein